MDSENPTPIKSQTEIAAENNPVHPTNEEIAATAGTHPPNERVSDNCTEMNVSPIGLVAQALQQAEPVDLSQTTPSEFNKSEANDPSPDDQSVQGQLTGLSIRVKMLEDSLTALFENMATAEEYNAVVRDVFKKFYPGEE